MNNYTFGDVDVGYYETIAGGAGAVSTNMPRCLSILEHLTRAQMEFEHRFNKYTE